MVDPSAHPSESAEVPHSPELLPDTLQALGELCMSARERSDLANVAEEHAALDSNPNSTDGNFLFGSGDINTTDGSVYRQVGTDAVHDLAESGIVRNQHTAKGEASSRWGHRVYWHRGEDGRAINVGSTDGSTAVIKADKADADAGWITADKVQAVYTKAPSGEVVDLLATRTKH